MNNKANYFLLEPFEIYHLSNQKVASQQRHLLEQINNLHNAKERALLSINNSVSPESETEFASLGLSNWSNILYYDFSPR